MAFSRPLRWVLRTLAVVLVLLAGAIAWLWWQLNGSLAPLDGEQRLPGLTAPVTVERDAQGIPTLSGANRPDLAYALGVLHAQERFFQMDLLRRNSAGELAELVGAIASGYDSRIRLHQFRKRADAALGALNQDDRRLLEAYSRGVNSGLNALDTAPFEYSLLRTQPAPWQPSDSLLALYSMYLDLQPAWNEQEQSRAVMRDLLPADWVDFLSPEGGRWDAPVQGEAYRWQPNFPQQPLAELQQPMQSAGLEHWRYRDAIQLGSNNWSVSGARTPYRAGMVANDMHLGLSVPNIWYRASWYLPDDGRRITGATLPGAPIMVVGSTERIAWGFTNSNADFQDSILLRVSDDGRQYRTPDGWEDFRLDTETIAVKGEQAIEREVMLTRWGPVIGNNHLGQPVALRWVAHDPEGANLNLMRMETADSVDEALTIAAGAGIPGQNLNVVDADGNQAWTLAGRLPNRFGFEEAGASMRYPSDWSTGEHGWDGYLSATDYPRVVNPDHGRIWTANARIAAGEQLATLGWGSYALGARQQQIRNRLFEQENFSEQDFLDIQLDDRAIFLERWQRLLLAVIDQADQSAFDALRGEVTRWQGRASASSVGYRAVKEFRETVIDGTVGAVYRQLADSTEAFYPDWIDGFVEYPVWALVNQQPEQHLPAGFDSWDDFMTAMVEVTLDELTATGPLAERTWGEANTLNIRHPLSSAVPWLSRWLDMPAEPMNGDTFMPLVQGPSKGASERLAVAPGHEEDGIFQMATGQSGHPLSPYYDRGHRDWVEGRPSGFLPGETEWEMVLRPE